MKFRFIFFLFQRAKICEKRNFSTTHFLVRFLASTQTPDLNEITEESTKSTGGPWKVVLWDDNEHTYEYVIEMLVEICMMTVEKAFLHAVQVDKEKEQSFFRENWNTQNMFKREF